MLEPSARAQTHKVILYSQPTWGDCQAAKRFFARKGVAFEERDVLKNEQYMKELKQLMGRFVTPTIIVDGEVLLGFALNWDRIRQLFGE